MIVGVYGDVLPAEVAAIAEITMPANAQIDGDGVLLLRYDGACLFLVKAGGSTISENDNVVELTRKPGRIQPDTCRADGTDDSSPVGVAAIDGTFEKGIAGDRPGGLCGIGFCGSAFDEDLEHASCTLGIKSHLLCQVLAEVGQGFGELFAARALVRDGPIAGQA